MQQENKALEEKVAEVEALHEQIHTYITNRQEAFDPFWDLLNLYNEAVEEVRTALHEADWDGKSAKFGPFSVSKMTDSGYDPKVLATRAPSVLGVPGVVRTVNKAAVAKLIKNGKLPRDVAVDAYYERPKTPRINKGPKVINFKL